MISSNMKKLKIKKIGVLTGGGDAPGLNAVIRALVKTSIVEYGWKVMGIEDGFDGLLKPGKMHELTLESVRGLLHRGGTILGTTNRSNPFAIKKKAKGKIKEADESRKVIKRLKKEGIDVLVVIGGDGSLHIARDFFNLGVPVVGIPKTIDNDIAATDVTFGFDTAITTAMEAIDKIHTTAESHHRVMIVEVMGRDVGWMALHAGLASSADVILIPEIPFNIKKVIEKIMTREKEGRNFSIVVVAEGAKPVGGKAITYKTLGKSHLERLGGIGNYVGFEIGKLTDKEVRVTTLGHIQRGGSPSAFDRILSSRFGHEAARLIDEKAFGQMVALKGQDIVPATLDEAIGALKSISMNDPNLMLAMSLGVSFGE